MLLSSDLDSIGELLKSPAKEYITAKGVESVSSPVANAGVGTERFISATIDAFKAMYKNSGEVGVAFVSGEEAEAVDAIKKGAEELASPEWVYGQTPKFVFEIPGVGEVQAEKGIITENTFDCDDDDEDEETLLRGKRFGGGVVGGALAKTGMTVEGEGVGWVLGRGGWEDTK
jgi:hypothetical protein